MNKRVKFSDWVLVLSCFILVSSTFVLSTSGQTWENEYGRIEVYPDVSRELITQKQFYNITWFYPDNDLDIAFCFNESLSYGGVYYWNGTSYKKALIEHIVYNSKHYYVLSEIHFAQDEIKHGYWEYNTPVNSSVNGICSLNSLVILGCMLLIMTVWCILILGGIVAGVIIDRLV